MCYVTSMSIFMNHLKSNMFLQYIKIKAKYIL